MRILTAMMKHETNSFSPVSTDLARFKSFCLYRDEAVQTHMKNTEMPIAAFLDLAESHGAEIISPVAAEAWPGGRVQKQTYETLCDWIMDPIRKGGIDAIFLDLHGAMTAEHVDDGEGELLKRIRRIVPGVPIAVTLDLHANLTGTMVDNCDVILGYKTYPHIDMYATGKKCSHILWDMMKGRCQPVMAWGRAPVLAQTLRMGSADEPMHTLQETTKSLESESDMLAATVLGGFPMVDVAHLGVSVVTVADKKSDVAVAARDSLLSQVWDNHEDFVYRHRPLAQTLQSVKDASTFPIILLDHADNVGSGGTSDVMTVIKAVIDAGLENVAVAAVYDPDAVKKMHAAGEGAELTLDIGGKIAMPSINLQGKPLTNVTGIVLKITNGRWVLGGPMYTGVQVDTGPTATFEANGVKIVVTSIHHEPFDAGILKNNGIDPTTCRYILLKSRIHYSAGFNPIQPDKSVHFTLDGEGVTTSDNSKLTYNKAPRPIYPLDKKVTYNIR